MADPTRYILAVDGGQSGTQVLLGTDDGTVLGVGRGGPVVHVRTELNASHLQTALIQAVPEALASCRHRVRRVDVAYLALTGGAEHAAAALAPVLEYADIAVESDVFAAIAAGTTGEPGIGVVAGTGSIAAAVTAAGERVVRGGWGFLVGDEGSGLWIGLQAVRAAAAMTDGRLPAGLLRRIVLDHFGVADMRDAAARIYADLDRAAIAGLAVATVAAADDRSDPVAVQIAMQAGEDLATLTVATATAAGLAGESVPVVPSGGVLRPGNTVWKAFAAKLARDLPGHDLLRPEVPPVVGAYWLGLRRLGISSADPAIRARVALSARQHLLVNKTAATSPPPGTPSPLSTISEVTTL